MINDIELIEDEIISIEEYGEIDTIDISVDDTRMFFANNIYTHNSGFGSEFVEAHQSGGSIKRIQKAHFFMSVAKTPAQQEANFANIRIIKARFAKDGQTFVDCVFNNDTMEIIITDPRFPNSNDYKNLKKYDDDDIDRVLSKANKIHSNISQHSEKQSIDKLNSDDINSLLRDNSASEKSFDAVNDGVSDAVNDGVSEIVIPIPKKIIPMPISDDDILRIENSFIDPDDHQGDEKNIRDFLVKKRDFQEIKKK